MKIWDGRTKQGVKDGREREEERSTWTIFFQRKRILRFDHWIQRFQRWRCLCCRPEIIKNKERENEFGCMGAFGGSFLWGWDFQSYETPHTELLVYKKNQHNQWTSMNWCGKRCTRGMLLFGLPHMILVWGPLRGSCVNNKIMRLSCSLGINTKSDWTRTNQIRPPESSFWELYWGPYDHIKEGAKLQCSVATMKYGAVPYLNAWVEPKF